MSLGQGYTFLASLWILFTPTAHSLASSLTVAYKGQQWRMKWIRRKALSLVGSEEDLILFLVLVLFLLLCRESNDVKCDHPATQWVS